MTKSEGRKRHDSPFQCTAEPPRPVPGRNEPMGLRVGSASSPTWLRKVKGSIAMFWNSSLRIE
jgi:hypothetical protein